jgi:hypothetical protein
MAKMMSACVVLAISSVSGPASAQWTKTVVDASGSPACTALAISPSGVSHLLYVRSGSFWHGSVSRAAPETVAGTAGDYCDLAIDAAGTLHAILGMPNFTGGPVRYASKSGSASWVLADVPGTAVGEYVSLAISSTGEIHVAYFGSLGEITYVRRNAGGVWQTPETISAPEVDGHTSIAVSGSTVYISYHKGGAANDLWYARRTGTTGSWTLEAVDAAAEDVGKYSSIAVVGTAVHVGYYDDGLNRAKYATRVGTGPWTIRVVFSPGSTDFGQFMSVAATSANAYFGFYDAAGGNLRVSQWTGSGWIFYSPDNTGDVGLHASIAVDSGGVIRVSYFNATDADIDHVAGP